MGLPHFAPLEVHPETKELFLRLPHPHDNIILDLTAPRTSDAAAIVHIMNDPAVYPWLGRPTMRYVMEDAEALAAELKHASDAVTKTLEDAAPGSFAEDCPVCSIREVQPDGTDVYIGNVKIKRCNWLEVEGAQRDRLMERNESRAAGDSEIVWRQVSDFVASSHHRRGIMTAVLRTFLDEWAIPRMGVRHIHVSVFTGNAGSVRVFEKNGFVLTGTLENCIEIRGEMRGLHVLDWHHRS